MAESHDVGDDEIIMAERREEYATQFFGFAPQSLFNGMYNIVMEYISEAVNALNESILNTFQNSVSEDEVKSISKKQAQVAVRRMDKLFDRTECYMKTNIFSVPAGMVLPEDRPHLDNPCSQQEHRALGASIEELENRILAVKLANRKLRQRITDVDSLQSTASETLEKIKQTHKHIVKDTGPEVQAKPRRISLNVKKTVDVYREIVLERTKGHLP